MLKALLQKLNGYKTWLINTVTFLAVSVIWVLPDLISLLAGFDMGELLPMNYAPYATLGLAVAGLIVRKFTTGPAKAWGLRNKKAEEERKVMEDLASDALLKDDES